MENILLKISYDGTDFCGWQRQDINGKQGERTVQGEIEKVLEKLFKQKTSLYGSGRTDSGVHAFAQAANFYSPVKTMKEENYVRAINSLLPRDIRILDAKKVSEEFNSRKSATSRVYRYFISFENSPSADRNRFCWHIPRWQPNLQRLNAYCECLKGEIDCAAFAASGDKSVSTFRYIEGARFFFLEDMWQKKFLVFEIEANAFLWKMVRTLTGTLVNFDRQNAPEDSLKKVLDSKDRRRAGVTAPPHGLFLYQIKFDGIRRHE